MLSDLTLGEGEALGKLLLDPGSVTEVGGVYRVNFERALVLTADQWRFDAGGIPRFSFLLASSRPVSGGGERDDDEVLLLRVDGVADLAQERDLLAVREEALREALVSGRDPAVAEVMHGLDPYTRERISFTGLDCRILGTFFEESVDGNVRLSWGSDIDNFYASSTYRVFKPFGHVLSTIASYVRPHDQPEAEPVRLGVVRYSSTRRRSVTAGHDDAAVEVNIKDFIGQKTGMFGMTRTGKSNSMKTIATQIFISSHRRGRPIGQLIFDPQGEYANVNVQDETALAALGEEHVRIYVFGGAADDTLTHVRPLGINFFDRHQIGAVQGIIAELLSATGDTAGYITDFMAAQLEDRDGDYGATARAQHARLLLYGALVRAGFKVPEKEPDSDMPFGPVVTLKKALADEMNNNLGSGTVTRLGRSNFYKIAGTRIEATCDWLVNHADHPDLQAYATTADWKSLRAIYEPGARRGWRYLIDLRRFHNPETKRPVADEIYEDLLDGRIVIVDLHLGPSEVIQPLSESIVLRLIRGHLNFFTSGDDPPHIQVMVEEAHTLFDRERYLRSRDPWVRLAKEASKLNIGLVYATQEVTGVAHQVLANTKNWVVAHLNNAREVSELSRFYDFESFADAIIRSEDKGYVRLKTESSPYTVPVQVDLFGPEMISAAHLAATGD